MGSTIRIRGGRKEDSFELNIVVSRWLFAGLTVLLVAAVSLGYAVLPAQSQDDRGRKAVNPGQNYSEAIEAGDFVFLSGKIAAVRGRIIPGGIEAETKMVMDNLQTALAKSGLTMDDVVKATVFLNDLNDFSAMNEVYRSYYTTDPPARSTIQSGVVLNAGIEIDLIAYRGGN